MELLPISHRTFSKFEYAERRQIGEKAKISEVNPDETINTLTQSELFNTENAEK